MECTCGHNTDYSGKIKVKVNDEIFPQSRRLDV
jgi:hypothetical protein